MPWLLIRNISLFRLTRQVNSLEDVEAVMADGQRNRTTAATKMNTESSRSHLLLQLRVSVRMVCGSNVHTHLYRVKCVQLADHMIDLLPYSSLPSPKATAKSFFSVIS